MSETLDKFRARVKAAQDAKDQRKRIATLQHRALTFDMGRRTVRKRVYFRWCLRRGLDPTKMENVHNFRRRRQWQREHSEAARVAETDRARLAAFVKENTK